MRSYEMGAFNSWDFEDDDREDPKVLELEQKIDDARDWFSEAIEILYGKRPFDSERLDYCLDEAATYLSYKIPYNDLQIVKKQIINK